MIQEFAKVTNDDKQTPTESTFYGTIVKYDNELYVRIDGSDQLTPITATADIKPNDRVVVMIKNHSATVTGNITSPSASSDSVKDLDGKVDEMGTQISEFEIVVADKIGTKEFSAQVGRIDTLVSDNVTIREELNANKASINELVAENVTITESLEAAHADIEKLDASKITADFVDAHYAKVEDLEATTLKVVTLEGTYGDFVVLTTNQFKAIDADIKNLDAEKLTVEQANLKYANIDFTNIEMAAVKELFTKSGIIKDLVVGDQSITGELVGVTIKGDLIEGSTIVADKLVIKGEDGIYYKLNTAGGVTPDEEITEEKLQNGLHGDVLIKKSITAEKINVHDLVAFGATIGGFHITDDAIYSGAKTSVGNTTRGIYMDNIGQLAIGDGDQYLRYYKDSDGKWKFQIAANSIRLGATSKTVEETIDDMKTEMETIKDANEKIDKLDLGGTNLLRNSTMTEDYDHWVNSGASIVTIDGVVCSHIQGVIGTTYSVSQNVLSKIDVNNLAQEYTFSVDIRLDNYVAGTTNPYVQLYFTGNYDQNGTSAWLGATDISGDRWISNHSGEGWIRMVWTVRFASKPTKMNLQIFARDFTGDLYFKNLKLEKGNKATDWTPAVEDIDEQIKDAQESANEAALAAATISAQQEIDGGSILSISNQLANLIVGGDGNTTFKEVLEDGTIRYNFSNMQGNIDAAVADIIALRDSDLSTSEKIDAINGIITEHSKTLSYIDQGDDNGVPFLELGINKDATGTNATVAKFKVRITNQSIQFLEDGKAVAWIDNDELHIEKSEIVSEQRIGNFVWAIRNNGNMGLMYKGGSS